MLNKPVLIRIAHLMSPRAWVMVMVLSLVVALSSAMVLAVSAGARLDGPLGAIYDRVEMFVRDTIRLTFKTDRHISELAVTVFMAPPGILEQGKNFNWLDNNEKLVAVTPAAQTKVSILKAPQRLLDPDWQPSFKGD
jgi:hypothetical protein